MLMKCLRNINFQNCNALALILDGGVSCVRGFLYLTESHIAVVFRRKTFLRKDCRGLTEYYKM